MACTIDAFTADNEQIEKPKEVGKIKAEERLPNANIEISTGLSAFRRSNSVIYHQQTLFWKKFSGF